ncbi:MAG: hypothetical protein JXB15_12755 [Anaerolineales bacterium]|nr:hypothetical protein [Anaerolineales bacterium]
MDLPHDVHPVEGMRDARNKKYSDWVVEFNDGTRVEGLDAILNREGGHGWELVNNVTEFSVGTSMHFGGANTTGFRAFFKQKLEE